MPLPLLPREELNFTGLAREDMIVRLQSLFNQLNPEYDDFSTAHPENLLLEGMAFYADILRGTMEERVRQLTWATITDRLAAIRLGRLSGFRLKGATAATVSGTFSKVGTPAVNHITIAEGLKIHTVDTDGVKKYRVVSSDGEILVGENTSNVVTLEQAELITEAFDSTLEPNLEVLLGSTPYIDGSVSVEADNGTFLETTTFLGATSSDKVFVVFVDGNAQARLRFGTGINGAIPQGVITVNYKVGGGTSGEVEAGALWAFDETVTDDLSIPVTLTFANTSSSAPAADAISVDEAKVRGPQSVQTSQRLMIESDFENVAESLGLARAFMATSNTDVTLAEDYGRLELVAYGTQLASGRYAPAAVSEATITAVRAAMAKDGATPPVMGFDFDIYSATFKDINVSVRIKKKSNYSASVVSTNVRNAIKDYFAVSLADRTPNPSIDFGARLKDSNGDPDYLVVWSSVFEAVLSAEGVRYIPSQANNLLLNNLQSSFRLNPREFPRLGTITIFDDDQQGAQI